MKSPVKLFIDLAFGRERDALEELRGRAGVAVRRKVFIRQLGACFPEVVDHPRFAQHADDVVAVAASALGIEAWGDDWLASPQGRRELQRNATLASTASLSASKAAERGRGSRRAAQPNPRDARHRPNWWERLREFNGRKPLRLRRLSATDRGRLTWYLDVLEEELDSLEDLSVEDWKRPVLEAERSRLSDEDRLKVHSSLVERKIRGLAKKKREAGEPPPGYSDTIKLAFFLGVGDDAVELRLRNTLAEYVELHLTPDMRTTYAGFEFRSPMHYEYLLHVKRLGLTEPSHVSRDVSAGIVWSWDCVSVGTARLLRYRIPMIQVDDFLESAAGDALQALVMPFPSLRAAACPRCGRLHTFDGRLNHRTDRVCPDH